MPPQSKAIKTADCPCKGGHSWNWHKDRGLKPCEHARNVKYANFKNWRSNARIRATRVHAVIAQNPGKMVWIPGNAIYVDEEEE